MNELAIVEYLRKLAARANAARVVRGAPARPAPGKRDRRTVSGAQAASGLILGIGDDCAVVRPRAGEDLLFKSDQIVEDIHFRRGIAPAIVGQRALARALSDIAAMGGEPRLCLVSLTVPQDLGERFIRAFYRGLLAEARRTGTALAGGDLAHAEKIYCDVCILGAVPKGQALRRDGARPGDAIYVSGSLGKPWDRRIEPRLELGRSLLGKATACMDISDGLALDLHRLCVASHAAAHVTAVPIHRGATLDRALHGGEDYELLFTMPASMRPPKGVMRIGTVVPAKHGKEGEVFFQGEPLPPRGYDHFQQPLQ